MDEDLEELSKLKYKNPKTPVLEGEDAAHFIEDMYKPLTEEEKKIRNENRKGPFLHFLTD